MLKPFFLAIPILAAALTAMPQAHAGAAAQQGARQDDTVMSSSGGGAWVDCDKANQRNNAKCAKERERAAKDKSASSADYKNHTTVPMAGPEGKGATRSGS